MKKPVIKGDVVVIRSGKYRTYGEVITAKKISSGEWYVVLGTCFDSAGKPFSKIGYILTEQTDYSVLI
jgi:hypothetical protein